MLHCSFIHLFRTVDEYSIVFILWVFPNWPHKHIMAYTLQLFLYGPPDYFYCFFSSNGLLSLSQSLLKMHLLGFCNIWVIWSIITVWFNAFLYYQSLDICKHIINSFRILRFQGLQNFTLFVTSGLQLLQSFC